MNQQETRVKVRSKAYVIRAIKKAFGDSWFIKDCSEFYGEKSDSLWTSGEEYNPLYTPEGDMQKNPMWMAQYYEDPDGTKYGAYNLFAKLGWYMEWYDGGTIHPSPMDSVGSMVDVTLYGVRR